MNLNGASARARCRRVARLAKVTEQTANTHDLSANEAIHRPPSTGLSHRPAKESPLWCFVEDLFLRSTRSRAQSHDSLNCVHAFATSARRLPSVCTAPVASANQPACVLVAEDPISRLHLVYRYHFLPLHRPGSARVSHASLQRVDNLCCLARDVHACSCL